MNILYNFIWIFFAYLLGSVNFSIILTKYSSKRKDIKSIGSKNAGATNAMRAYGFKFGLIVFLLDTSKSYWLGFSLGLLQNNVEAFKGVIPQLALLFVIIGHIFPIYFNFKGGKGAATLLGMIASISMFLAVIGALLFICLVWWTKYVSLGSITIPYILAFLSFICPYFNHLDTTITYGSFWINPLFLFIGALIVACSHYQNIIRLVNRNESKISFSSFNKSLKDKKENNKIDQIDSKSQTSFNKQISNESIIDIAADNNFNNH